MKNNGFVCRKVSSSAKTLACLCLLGIMLPLASQGGSWWEWLSVLFRADGVPTPPELTVQDRKAIEQARIVIEAHNEVEPTTANFLMLGLMAAAERHEDQAAGLFQEGARLAVGSSLPATLTGQIHLQAGDYDQAARWHERALEQLPPDGPQALSLLAANSHMDLAVTYSKLERVNEAEQQLSKAQTLLATSALSAEQKALGYLQVGTVYQASLDQQPEAIAAWVTGSETLRETSPESFNLLRLQMDLNIVQSAIELEQDTKAREYLKQAQEIVKRLPEEEQAPPRLVIGANYGQLAQQRTTRVAEDQQAAVEQYQRVRKTARQPELRLIAIREEKKLTTRSNPPDKQQRINQLNQEQRKVRGEVMERLDRSRLSPAQIQRGTPLPDRRRLRTPGRVRPPQP